MNWYIAKIIFKISTLSSNASAQFDERLHLLQATTQEEALLKARLIGLQQEDESLREKKSTTQWEFVNVFDIQNVQALQDGATVYSQICEQHKTEDYIEYVHLRAMFLHRYSFETV